MESYFSKSISIIKKNNTRLHSKIINLPESNIINRIFSKNGDAVPEVNLNNRKLCIHSRFDPIKEASRFIAEIDPLNFSLFIVFGFGFAYHIEELLNKIDTESILLVLEKNPLMIKMAISSRDLTSIFRDERVKILVDPDEDTIAESMRGKSSRKVSFLTHRGSFQIDPEYYTNLSRVTKSYLSTKEVNIATLSKFEKIWSSNICRNIKDYINCPGANIFYNQMKELPAIVVGAGPSLNNSLDFIEDNKHRALIIAVDTSYLILKKNGIEPHFCISVDPQVINARYFESGVSGNTIFIVDPTIHPSVFRFIKGKIVSVGMAFEMMKWIEEATGNKGALTYGGSVTTNAYDFAKRIGASPVVLVGQDLAFTDGLAHARGSYLDEQVHYRVNRFYNSQTQNRFQVTALPKIFVQGIRSKNIHTNQKLMIFLSWFEKREDSDLINATYDGALIKGVTHLSSDDIAFNATDKDVFEVINGLYHSGIEKITNKKNIIDKLGAKCQKMLKDIDYLIPILERAVSLSHDFILLIKSEKRDQGKLDYILNKLSETDRVLESKNTLTDMIGFTVQRVIHTITEGYEIDEEDENLKEDELVAKKSLYLYEGILEGSVFNRKILRKMSSMLRS